MKSFDANRLTIHIGLHKTGTTFLQRNIFPHLRNVFEIRGKQPLRSVVQSRPGDNVLFTDEALSGTLLGGKWGREFSENLLTLKKVFKDPKIIVGFRKHDDMILSIYKQYLQEGGTKEFDFIFNKQDTGLIRHDELLFEPRINQIREHFDDVFVYTKEALEARFEKFIPALCRFMEIEDHAPGEFKISYPNLGVKTNLQVKLLRQLNGWDKRMKRFPGSPSINGRLFVKLRMTPRLICQEYLKSWKSDTFKIPSEIENFINDRYQNDWKFTEKSVSF